MTEPTPISVREYRPTDLEACRRLWRSLIQRHREGFRLLGRFELSIALEASSPFGSARTTEIQDLVFDC